MFYAIFKVSNSQLKGFTIYSLRNWFPHDTHTREIQGNHFAHKVQSLTLYKNYYKSGGITLNMKWLTKIFFRLYGRQLSEHVHNQPI